jgi:hypothetical protein
MKSIGGYLGLEIGSKINSLIDDKYLFNSGRSSCLFYLKEQSIDKLWVPYYICGDFIDTLRANGIRIQFYNINGDFEIQSDIENSESILFVNYFGVKDDYIKTISKKYRNLIIDNSQALFNNPVESLPTFYSVRKFIGVPDGGMLYADDLFYTEDIQDSYSYGYSSHLLKQIDKGTESGYSEFQINEKQIIDSDISKMSTLTMKIIDSVNLSSIKDIRYKNSLYLRHNISRHNKLILEHVSLYTFPLLVDNGNDLRNYLISKKVFTPTLWYDQLELIESDLERNFIENIVHLPIDQRYGIDDMNIIIQLIQDYDD